MLRRFRFGTPSKRVAGSVHMLPRKRLHNPHGHQRLEATDVSGRNSVSRGTQRPSWRAISLHQHCSNSFCWSDSMHIATQPVKNVIRLQDLRSSLDCGNQRHVVEEALVEATNSLRKRVSVPEYRPHAIVIALSLSVQELLPLVEEEVAAPTRVPLSSGAESGPLGPLSFEGAQHRQILRPSVDGVRSKALRPFGSL